MALVKKEEWSQGEIKMKLIYECNNCGNKHRLTQKEINNLKRINKCSYRCKCNSLIKIVNDNFDSI